MMMFRQTSWPSPMANIIPASATELTNDGSDEQLIRPSCRAANCLRVAPDAPFVSLGGVDTHVIRNVNDVSLLAKPGCVSFEGHAVSSGGIFAFIVNRRVAVLNIFTQAFCLSESELIFDVSDIAVGASTQYGKVFVAVVGCEGVALWRMSANPNLASEGTVETLHGPVHISGTEQSLCSKVAIMNSTLAVATVDGRILIWDDIAHRIWHMDEDEVQFASETVFERPSKRLLSDKITEISFSNSDGHHRLAVAWWTGCVELYQRKEEEWSLIWSISNEHYSTLSNQDFLGHDSSGTFAVFATHCNLFAVNSFYACIRFLTSSDGKLVWEVAPEENAGEVKGLAATEKGVLVWYRGLLSLRLIEWPVLQLAKLSKQLQKPVSSNPVLSAPSTDKVENCAFETPENEVWRNKLYEVLDVIVYHRKGSSKLTIRNPNSRKNTCVLLPFNAKTLRVTADEGVSGVDIANESTLVALDVFANHELVACLFAKAILIFRVSQNSWNAIICDHAVERGAVSVDRSQNKFDIVAAVSSRGELWRWNIETLSLVSPETVVLPGPVFSIIGCANGSGTFAALGWRYEKESNKVDKTFNGRYLVVVLPEWEANEANAVEMSLPCLDGKLPGCILALWKKKKVLVILFEIARDLLLAASYSTTDLEFLDSKTIRREMETLPLAYPVARHNIPGCFSPETAE